MINTLNMIQHNADEPSIMGILNCTPDSFYEGSRKQTAYDIACRADEIIAQGGRIIDIGAFSTRPGADMVSADEELRRMRMALEIVRKGHPEALLSIDTYRPEVARMAVEEYGAQMINDVSEGGITGIVDTALDGEMTAEDGVPAIFREVARLGVAYILMSVQADMDGMIANFRKEVAMLRSLGVGEIILDPGFGFGKEVLTGNYRVLSEMHRLREEFPGLPLLAGVSRKRMIWQLLGCSAQDTGALYGTMLVNMVALQQGASILRVHDVKEAAETIRLYRAMHNS